MNYLTHRLFTYLQSEKFRTESSRTVEDDILLETAYRRRLVEKVNALFGSPAADVRTMQTQFIGCELSAELTEQMAQEYSKMIGEPLPPATTTVALEPA